MSVSMLLPIVIAISLRLPGGPAVQAPSPDRWLGPDKIKHFALSAFVQGVGYAALRGVGAEHRLALAGASVGTAVVGVGREVYDRREGRIFSRRDLVWDAAGAAAMSVALTQTVR